MSAKFVVGEPPETEIEDVTTHNNISINGEEDELTVFGNFDKDDPDFMSPNGTPPAAAASGGRSRSRLSGSRNSSSSSLRRIASNNSIGRQLSENLRQLSFERLLDRDGVVLLAQFKVGDDEIISSAAMQNQSTQCHSCGAIWNMEQFSLDCDECGGAAMYRPCLSCNGTCREQWMRDLVSSHTFSRASWIGQCAFNQNTTTTSDLEDGCDDQLVITVKNQSTSNNSAAPEVTENNSQKL